MGRNTGPDKDKENGIKIIDDNTKTHDRFKSDETKKNKNNTTTNNESKNLEGITDLGINKTKKVNDKEKKEIDEENMDIPVKETNNLENKNELEVQDNESQDIQGHKEAGVQRDDI